MARLTKLLALLPAALLAASLAQAAETMYVKSAVAKIFENPDFRSKQVGALGRGDQLTVVTPGSTWLKIKGKSAEGWVMSMLLSTKPPLEPASLLENTKEDISDSARKRPSAIVSAGASRGLVSTSRLRLSDEGKRADWEAIRDMDALRIDPGKAIAFVSPASASEVSK